MSKVESNVYQGAGTYKDNLVQKWVSFHEDAKEYNQIQGLKSGYFRDEVDKKSYKKLFDFSKIKCKQWHSLCTAAGWTVYGAVALSWCEGAVLKDVWKGWEASGFPLIPKPEFERPARFINPALLPQTNKISEIKDASGSNILAFCAMIVALGDTPPDFDLSSENLKTAPVPIAAFLKSRMLRKEERTEQEDALIRFWGDKIKGSKFDVWEDG